MTDIKNMLFITKDEVNTCYSSDECGHGADNTKWHPAAKFSVSVLTISKLIRQKVGHIRWREN